MLASRKPVPRRFRDGEVNGVADLDEKIRLLSNYKQFKFAPLVQFDPNGFDLTLNGSRSDTGVDGIPVLQRFIPWPGLEGPHRVAMNWRKHAFLLAHDLLGSDLRARFREFLSLPELDAERLRDLHEERLAGILRYASEKIPFYRERAPRPELSAFPVLRKEDIHAHLQEMMEPSLLSDYKSPNRAKGYCIGKGENRRLRQTRRTTVPICSKRILRD